MNKFGLLGEKLPHSFSVPIHSLFGNDDYALFEVNKEELDSFFNEGVFEGINVTIPYKEAAMKYCSTLDTAVENIGALNTVVRIGKEYMGYNTDIYGFIYLIRCLSVEVNNRKAVILGSGGTSKMACFALSLLGASEIVVVSRSSRSYETKVSCPVSFVSYEEVEKFRDADLLVNTTPVGMYPNNFEAPIDLDIFTRLCGVADVIYNPLETELVAGAKRRNIPAINGLGMLVAQAYFAEELFFHRAVNCNEGNAYSLNATDSQAIERVLERVEATKGNISLIGMPGCGKSTLGQALSKRLGRTFVDSDEEFLSTYGISPAECIKEYGEKEFRNRETEVIKNISKLNSAVIATGGGVVTRPENMEMLKRNGRVIFLDRDISKLPTGGRPLSKGDGALERLYKERMPLYLSYMDYRVNVCDCVEDSLDELMLCKWCN